METSALVVGDKVTGINVTSEVSDMMTSCRENDSDTVKDGLEKGSKVLSSYWLMMIDVSTIII